MYQSTRFIIVNSHPIQYFAPLYRAMAVTPGFDVIVLYCSQHGLKGEIDQQFGVSAQWDVPLLDGYTYQFLSNQSWRPSIYNFWGLLNLSIIHHLWRAERSVVIVHGWAYAVCWITILFAKLFGHTVSLRAESPLNYELSKPLVKQRIRQWLLGRGLFSLVNRFLYIGKQNLAFYQHMGVPTHRLIYTPYAVDNARFQNEADILRPQRFHLRQLLGISPEHDVLLYCGKYVTKKRPLDLLEAVFKLQRPNLSVILMGDGELRPELEAFVRWHRIPNIHLTGFVNQSGIGQYFISADLFVLCSNEAETWGLATNEAMNFALPVVVSNAVGCADDLAVPGKTGDIYPTGDVNALTRILTHLLDLKPDQRAKLGNAAKNHIDQYSYSVIISNLQNAFCTQI